MYLPRLKGSTVFPGGINILELMTLIVHKDSGGTSFCSLCTSFFCFGKSRWTFVLSDPLPAHKAGLFDAGVCWVGVGWVSDNPMSCYAI